ncbi:MAG: M28 family peptidase [Ignavibacteriales bacterium]|nr:M28 family peptidase [Ignavibacteriales bacterium]
MKTLSSIFIIIFIISVFNCAPKVDEFISTDITSSELRQHVKDLTSHNFAGRRSGEEGNRKAAEYIADKFKEYGLSPAGANGGYFQEFKFVSSTKVGANNKFELNIDGKNVILKPKDDYRPLSSSIDTSLTTKFVFAGFGIAAPDSLNYNDYTGLDVKGKLVLVMRGSPDTSVSDKFFQHSSVMAKLFTAREKGAVGIIFLAGMPGTKSDNLGAFEDPRTGGASIAVLSMKWNVADSIFTIAGKNLLQIKQKIESELKPNSFEFEKTTVNLVTQIEKIRATTANVVGYLEGSDSVLSNEVIVIGAHFDHLGMGGEGSGSLKPDTIAPHVGADDNASGTAGLLELAQNLSSQKHILKRSIVFVAFTGEELGVLGSDYYVKNPFKPLDKTITMVNMDMIGRMKDSVLVIEGMGTSPIFDSLMKRENLDSLTLKLKPDGFGPSDQASFYKKDIPVVFFFTNLHSDYHKPSDTWEKLNYVGEEKIVRMAKRVVIDIAKAETKPPFTKSTPLPMGGDRQGARVTLGIIPDFASDVPGMKISGTRPGSPAEKAGLIGDDVIIKFGGKEIKNIYDFTYLLGQFKPGDEVEVVVKRGNEEKILRATLIGK